MRKPLNIPYLFVAFFVCSAVFPIAAVAEDVEADDYAILKEIIVLEFAKESPHEWGTAVSGVKTRMQTDEKVVALTLDASGRDELGANSEILILLQKENIPVTLFVSGEWIDKNPVIAKTLAQNPQFEIANLGLQAKSCSVTGKSPTGEQATQSVEEVFTEIEKNARKIESLTGMLPRFFRSGVMFYDDVAVRIARALGYEVVGSTVSAEKSIERGIIDLMLTTSAGSILVIPLDGVQTNFAEGLRQAISKLRIKGFQFVKLGDYPLE